MAVNRRDFLKQFAGFGSFALLGRSVNAHAGPVLGGHQDHLGVLVDTTLCVGCRSCERACNEINKDLPRRSSGWFQDSSVFEKRRRMSADSYTIVNRYNGSGKPHFAKFQCMHCMDPACVSACIVGALTKEPNGAVRYDPWKCIGCRYCMVACPFQVPAYEYGNALTPQVRKCTFCFEQRTSKGKMPACVESCPMEVMTFGERKGLIQLGKRRIRKNPELYIPHIYGENEVGGTAWLYLSSLPFGKMDLPKLGYISTPSYTEPIQHAIFKHFIPPIALFSVLGILMWFLKPVESASRSASEEEGAKK